MTIKYKSYKDSTNTVISFTKWDNSTFLMAIPLNPENTDYKIYLQWVADGGVTEAAEQAAKLNIEITKPTQQNGYRTGNV